MSQIEAHEGFDARGSRASHQANLSLPKSCRLNPSMMMTIICEIVLLAPELSGVSRATLSLGNKAQQIDG